MPQHRDLIDISAGSFRTEPLRERNATAEMWARATTALASGSAVMLGLWGDTNAVRMTLHAPGTRHIGVLRFETMDSFPSVGRQHPAAQRLERSIVDLYGLVPHEAPDTRPWLDHGKWGIITPLGIAVSRDAPAVGYSFLPVEGESLHQVPVGPVHAGIIEPGHFRFTAQGETVVRLEERLGYVHKGIDGLMRGADVARGTELASRVSGDSTVAYGWAFAQAVEAALGLELPPRAHHVRALAAELERLANHFGDIGAICNDAAFAIMLAHCSVLREKTLRTADAAFGHRLMRGVIAPGGIARDFASDGHAAIEALCRDIHSAFPPLVELYDNTASLLDRTVGTGQLAPDLATAFGAGGFVGRACGRDFDTRRDLPYAPYHDLNFAVPLRTEGDVNARIWIRIEEVHQSLDLIAQLLANMPAGPASTDVPKPKAPVSGLGLVEGFRGDILAWISLNEDGTIAASHLRDPSWFQWPLLESVIEGNIIADFPLCNKSFNCSYSGHDL